MKYINSASLLHAIGADPSCGKCKQSRTDCMCQSLSRMDICGLVEDVPYEEIVHCGECARFDKRTGCNLVDGLNIAKEDSFCSYGEKKE